MKNLYKTYKADYMLCVRFVLYAKYKTFFKRSVLHAKMLKKGGKKLDIWIDIC